MNIDDFVDEVAFGKVRRKPGPRLGLYLSPEVIYISETHLERGKVVVDHLVRIPVPASGKGGGATATLNSDFLTDNEKLPALIKQSMSAIKWNSNEVIVTLSHHLGLLRYFTMPGIDRRYWSAAVPLEAKKYIPIPFESLSHDFQIAPAPPDASNKPRQGALICVTQRKNLASIGGLLESLGLKLIGMEVAPCSVLRVWEALDPYRKTKTHCQVHFDGGNIRILIADKGLPVFFRELFLGQDVQLGDLRKIDLGGCVGFAQKQLGIGAVAHVFISGGIPDLRVWQDSFTKDLGMATVSQDTPKLLGIKGGDWGGYAAIGASLRLLSPTPVMLDLGQIGRVTVEERHIARDIFGIAGVLTLFFALVGLWRTLSYSFRARELQTYRRDSEIEAVFKGKSPAGIEDVLKAMRLQLQAADVLSSNETIKTTALLKDLVNAMPDNTWLTRIHLMNPLSRHANQDVVLGLTGRAKGATTSAEQDLPFEYRQKLLKTLILGKNFPEIFVEVASKPMPDAGGSASSGASVDTGMDPSRLQEILEQRTEFTVSMKKKL